MIVAWHPKQEEIASASYDQTISLRNVPRRVVTRVFTAPETWGKTVGWSPDGRLIATGSFNRGPIVWHADSGQLAWPSFGKTYGVNAIVADPKIGIMVGVDAGELSIFKNGCHTGAKHIVVCSYPIIGLALSPDKALLAVGSWDGSITLLRTTDWTVVRIQRIQDGAVNSVSWSPDGKFLATGGYDETIRVVSIDGELVGKLAGHTGALKSVAWSPDGRFLASGSRYDAVHGWDMKTLALARLLNGELGPIVNCVAWSPTGKHLAMCGKNCTV